MSLRQRVNDIASSVATQVAQQLIEIRVKQIAASLSSMATVSKISGNQVTLNMADGTQTTVTNAGGRIVGVGDAMVTDGHSVAL